jgi:hypothetical protein
MACYLSCYLRNGLPKGRFFFRDEAKHLFGYPRKAHEVYTYFVANSPCSYKGFQI